MSSKPANSPAVRSEHRKGSSASNAMVRTQIYLNREEHEFVRAEANRMGSTMAEVIRGMIREKMEIPEEAWVNNPMLELTPDDPEWEGHEDGAINHDHYIYGSPKNYEKVNGEWVSVPPGK